MDEPQLCKAGLFGEINVAAFGKNSGKRHVQFGPRDLDRGALRRCLRGATGKQRHADQRNKASEPFEHHLSISPTMPNV